MLSPIIPMILWAAGRVDSTNAVYRWQTGQFAAQTQNGAGDITHNLSADYGVDATESMPQMTPDAAAAASGLVGFGYASASDTAKRVTVLKEAALGAASALTNVDYYFAIWKLIPRT